MFSHDQPNFADRHIGPDADAVATMLKTIGVGSLDELADKALPAGILDALSADGVAPGLDQLPQAATRGAGAGRVARARRRQHRRGVDDRSGLLRHADTAGAAAQHPRKPGLVHGLHALPAGDQPGPTGGAAELPDHGRRPDRPRGGQRVDARRGHRGRRGDDTDAPRGARARRTGWPSTAMCSGRPRPCWPPGPNRSASRSSPPTCGRACPTASSSG